MASVPVVHHAPYTVFFPRGGDPAPIGIAVINQKGGVGKAATATLGVALAKLRYRLLLVHSDPRPPLFTCSASTPTLGSHALGEVTALESEGVVHPPVDQEVGPHRRNRPQS